MTSITDALAERAGSFNPAAYLAGLANGTATVYIPPPPPPPPPTIDDCDYWEPRGNDDEYRPADPQPDAEIPSTPPPPVTADAAKVPAKNRRRVPGDYRPNATRALQRFELINVICDRGCRSLSERDFITLVQLWRNERSGLVKCSQKLLATRMGVSTRTVQRAIRSLELKYWLRVVRAGNEGKGSNWYQLLIPNEVVDHTT